MEASGWSLPGLIFKGLFGPVFRGLQIGVDLATFTKRKTALERIASQNTAGRKLRSAHRTTGQTRKDMNRNVPSIREDIRVGNRNRWRDVCCRSQLIQFRDCWKVVPRATFYAGFQVVLLLARAQAVPGLVGFPLYREKKIASVSYGTAC